MSKGNLCINFYEGDSVKLIVNGVECIVTLREISGRQAKLLFQAEKDKMRIERDTVRLVTPRSGKMP